MPPILSGRPRTVGIAGRGSRNRKLSETQSAIVGWHQGVGIDFKLVFGEASATLGRQDLVHEHATGQHHAIEASRLPHPSANRRNHLDDGRMEPPRHRLPLDARGQVVDHGTNQRLRVDLPGPFAIRWEPVDRKRVGAVEGAPVASHSSSMAACPSKLA